MSETMYDCYLSQFACMKKVLENKESILKGFSDFYMSKKPERVYLIGSGTSYNACAAAASFMEELLGLEVTVLAPTCIKKIYGQNVLAIAVSQGGRSTNTVSAVEALHSQNCPVVTLTDPAETPVGQAGDFPVLLAADDEKVGPKTRGYMVTVLTLYLMALEAALKTGHVSEDDYSKYIASLESMAQQGEEWIELCQKFYDANAEDLKKATHYLFAGKDIRGKVAQEAALKVLETLCFAANGYEYEEFLHGPACCTDEALALFLYLSNDEDQARMIKTAKIIGQASANTYIVSHDAAVTGDNILYLPGSEEAYLSPFSDILFAQLISAKLTEEMGRERHAAVKNIFQDMGTKVPQA